ncbi:MAG: serine--tRNA ligase [Elusimicrobia bacterium CG11_big_fil_rev_8_21_14_0_20_64_6]|nr:MAG: serine--tRNA ligase [Elusimicrobia bacterium CG11_big_fil_rev_8_21_14_0_20_64_6]
MIDLGAARKNAAKVRQALSSRNQKFGNAFDDLLKLDESHRAILNEVEDMRAKRNSASAEIGKAMAAKAAAKAELLKASVSELKARMTEKESALTASEKVIRAAAMNLPNIPHESVPVGKDETENPVVRTLGEPRRFDFKPLDHQSIGEKLGALDLKTGVKIAGSRFALWQGSGAKLIRALGNFLLDRHEKSGYLEVHPPYLALPEVLEGTSQLPKFEADMYKTVNMDGDKASTLYLISTSEIVLTNMVREEILPVEKLPMKLTALTACFRQEAGTYGKDVRGVIRNHQFDKVELVWITKPEDSLPALEQLTKDAADALEALDLPYRVIHLCTGDMGFASQKTYDIEVWMPSENNYREISSCSDCSDFQARRMAARFRRDAKASPELVHTLNGSGVAVGRLAAAILENNQQADGSVAIPRALVPYFGAERIAVG